MTDTIIVIGGKKITSPEYEHNALTFESFNFLDIWKRYMNDLANDVIDGPGMERIHEKLNLLDPNGMLKVLMKSKM